MLRQLYLRTLRFRINSAAPHRAILSTLFQVTAWLGTENLTFVMPADRGAGMGH